MPDLHTEKRLATANLEPFCDEGLMMLEQSKLQPDQERIATLETIVRALLLRERGVYDGPVG